MLHLVALHNATLPRLVAREHPTWAKVLIRAPSAHICGLWASRLHRGHGGASDLDNLVLLCHRHHWSVHEGGWQAVRTDGREVLAISPSPTHRTWTRAPDGATAA